MTKEGFYVAIGFIIAKRAEEAGSIIMSGPFDFLHIKGKTAGSSNELSFDVLEAARNDANRKNKRSNKIPSAPKPSQGTYHGVAGTSTLSAAPEVSRRKKARKAHSVGLGIIAVIAVVALAGTGVYLGYRYLQGENDFTLNINSTINKFIEIDSKIVKVDELMNDPLNSSNLAGEAEIEEEFPSLMRDLNALEAEAKEMSSTNPGSNKALYSGIEAAARARKNLLSKAEGAFAVARQMSGLENQAEEAWNEVLAGDDIARAAAQAANEARTNEATNEARQLTVTAHARLIEARFSLKAIGSQTPGDVFGTETSYIEKRVESLEAAIATADALLAGDKEEATVQNEAYNVADREAAALARELSLSPKEQVKKAFEDDSARWMDGYNDAREDVAEADATIRSYL